MCVKTRKINACVAGGRCWRSHKLLIIFSKGWLRLENRRLKMKEKVFLGHITIHSARCDGPRGFWWGLLCHVCAAGPPGLVSMQLLRNCSQLVMFSPPI